MVKKSRLPPSPLADIARREIAEEELNLRMELLRQEFWRDRSHTLPAFEALAALIADVWDHKRPVPAVSVPRWAAELLVEGIMRYRESALNNGAVTLGEAYGLEGGGQGKRSKIQKSLQNLRNIRIATGDCDSRSKWSQDRS